MPSTLSREEAYAAHAERVWNSLIPRCAVTAQITENPNRANSGRQGVRYLHPTKGYRYVSKRRFAAQGVI